MLLSDKQTKILQAAQGRLTGIAVDPESFWQLLSTTSDAGGVILGSALAKRLVVGLANRARQDAIDGANSSVAVATAVPTATVNDI